MTNKKLTEIFADNPVTELADDDILLTSLDTGPASAAIAKSDLLTQILANMVTWSHALTQKTIPLPADEIMLLSAADSYAARRSTLEAALSAICLPAFHAYQAEGAPTAIGAISVGVVLCGTEAIDTGGYHDPATGKFTPLVAGTYTIKIAGALKAVVDRKEVWVGLRKNGTTSRWSGLANTSNAASSAGGGGGSFDVYLNGSTDYIEFVIYNGDASSRNTYDTGSNVCWWMGHRISNVDIAGW